MIRECTVEDMNTILSYIGKDYGRCIYVYIDLIKYGLDNENLFAWIQENEKGEICCLITEYYKGIQLYSRDVDLLAEELAAFLKKKNPPVIMGVKATVDAVRDKIHGYVQELGIIGELKQLNWPEDKRAYRVNESELKEIVDLVSADVEIGQPYGFDSLFAQYIERYRDGFGRNFVLRDSESDEIICHAGTYAEIDNVAVIGGVITAPDYRGKGLSKGALAAICKQLIEEGKDVFSFFYSPMAKKMHFGVGFEKLADWAKLKKGK